MNILVSRKIAFLIAVFAMDVASNWSTFLNFAFLLVG